MPIQADNKATVTLVFANDHDRQTAKYSTEAYKCNKPKTLTH